MSSQAGSPAVVVGPVRPGFPDVTWALEDPAGSGPLAAVAAGLAALPPSVDRVLVVGGDMPYVALARDALHEALTTSDVALLVDAEGRDQPLAALWVRTSLDAGAGRRSLRWAAYLCSGSSTTRPSPASPTRGAHAQDVDTLDDLTRLADRP